jgi:hypothetical protein
MRKLLSGISKRSAKPVSVGTHLFSKLFEGLSVR